MKSLIFFALVGVAALSGCASPASDIKVKTMSMDRALNAADDSALDKSKDVSGRTVNAVIRQGQPMPFVTAPDIRMAYLYQSADNEGNMFFGGWVGIPVDTFKWITPEGGTVPMQPSVVTGK